MNTNTTTTVKILRVASTRLSLRLYNLQTRRDELKQIILDRWPEEVYGMRWVEKYEKRSALICKEIKRCEIALSGLSNIINEITYHLEDY